MSMLQEHRKSRKKTPHNILHDFRIYYKKNTKMVYGFVEGKEDPCYYRGMIEDVLPSRWGSKLFPVDGKANVLEIYSKLNWRHFNKKQVFFLVDRDLSEFTNEKILIKENIYITDKYSIENNIVNKRTLDRTLTEVCGFSNLTRNDRIILDHLFENQFESFLKLMVPIMTCIIYWRKNKKRACLNKIKMKKIFEIKQGKINLKTDMNNKQSIIKYIHKECKIDIDPSYDEIIAKKDFLQNNYHKKFTRGKYVFWFFIEFCLSVHKDCTAIISIDKKPKLSSALSHANAMMYIAPRCKMPDSLKTFFKNTIGCYVNNKKVA